MKNTALANLAVGSGTEIQQNRKSYVRALRTGCKPIGGSVSLFSGSHDPYLSLYGGDNYTYTCIISRPSTLAMVRTSVPTCLRTAEIFCRYLCVLPGSRRGRVPPPISRVTRGRRKRGDGGDETCCMACLVTRS